MEKDQIQKKLSEKYDELTTKVLTGTIFEFQELFKEKYLTTEDVISLVTQNIPKGIVIYTDKDDIFDATCSISTGEFKVHKEAMNEEDYFKYIFFHEFIHSISFKKHGDMQFMGFYTIEKGEEYEFKSRAFNEAVTEFMALKRNKMCGYEPENKYLSGYDVGTDQLNLLTKVIPEEELIGAYFNEPGKLEEIFIKYGMNMDELFYAFYLLEEKEYEVHSLEARRGLDNAQDAVRIIDGERYIFYNMLDHFGEVKSEEEFNKKWAILLSELDLKYNFFKIDGIFKYGQLVADMEKLNLGKNELVDSKVSSKILEKYARLNGIVNPEDKMATLKELSDIYHKDYNEYWSLVQDDFAILAYMFVENIKNNYQLYDIESYPRVYPYLEKENATIEDVDFGKRICEEENIKFFVFNIKGKIYIESNYDDTTVSEISENLFEVTYADQRGVLNIKDNTYEIGGNKFEVKQIY